MIAKWICFNPRARAGRDAIIRHFLATHKCFNPRARAGRDAILAFAASSALGFNPRARAGRDINLPHLLRCVKSFNPRARAGRDANSALQLLYLTVSIHAPARGATRTPWAIQWRYWSFNPRARAGRDPFAPGILIANDLFQSTRPRGARLSHTIRHR